MILQYCRVLDAEQRRLVRENLGLAYEVLSRFRVRREQLDDARGEAMLGLCEAARTYQPGKGAFSTWAWSKVRWRLLDWRARNAASGVELPTDELDVTSEARGPDVEAVEADSRRHILRAVGRAAPRVQRAALLALEGLTKAEIAAELGCSVSTVARIRKEVRESLFPLKEIMAEREKA